MPKTVVGLFRKPEVADQVVREIEALGFARNEVSRLKEPDTLEVSGVMSFPRLDFEASLDRGLRKIGATEAEAKTYVECLRQGGAVIFATDPDQKRLDTALEVMNRHNAIEVEEGRGPMPGAPHELGEGRTSPQRLDIAGRVAQAPQPGNRYFSW